MPIEPHGGELVNRVLSPAERERWRRVADELAVLTVDADTLLDLENLATGAFSPLKGFMDRETLEAVAAQMQLPQGPAWSLPILLQQRHAPRVAVGEPATIRGPRGEVFGVLEVREVFTLDLARLARAVWGTDDPAHPGVARFYEKGRWAVAGEIWLVRRVEHLYRHQVLTPAETRACFKRRGWQTVVAFQTRNAPHRAHEYLQRLALEIADGLFIHPILGPKKADDFSNRAILEAYKTLIEHFYPRKSVFLAGFATAMRYAGPREAVFHAIVRQNFGATHFIVGRDHAGVGEYYDPFAAQRIFDQLGQALKIQILKAPQVFFCPDCEGVASDRTCPHGKRTRVNISMSRIRAMLRQGQLPPPEMIRPQVAKVLLAEFDRREGKAPRSA